MSKTVEARAAGSKAGTALWVVQALVAVAYVLAGASKVGSAEAAVVIFDRIGWGDWFRYLMGGLEIIAAVGLLVRSFVVRAAVALGVLITVAIVAHLAIGDTNGLVFLVPLVLVGVIAYARRKGAPHAV